MKRRVFLKCTAAGCGVALIGLPPLKACAGQTPCDSASDCARFYLNGIKRNGCVVPSGRYNHHEVFPQDISDFLS